MEFATPLKIAASGLQAQTGRMRVIAENIANADSTAPAANGEPYRRRVPEFKAELDRQTGATMVRMTEIKLDQSDFRESYDPGHPSANAEGYVRRPNVNTLVETVDLRQAQRSYEANLNVINATRTMLARTLDILRA